MLSLIYFAQNILARALLYIEIKASRKHYNHTPEVNIMETSLTTVFAGLSIVLGLMVGFGTLSVVRGVFTFLMFVPETLKKKNLSSVEDLL